MYHLRGTKPIALFVGLCLVLVTEALSIPVQHAAQLFANNDVDVGEVALSLVVNQIAVLKLLNESSSSCSSQTGRKTYKKYDDSVTQPEALKACQQLGGRLALPTNNEENQLIRREIGLTSPGISRPGHWGLGYWISGTDHHEEGNWVDSVTGEPLRYTNFGSGEPNNSNGIEHCIRMHPKPDAWTDANCDTVIRSKGYVCEFVN